MHARASSGEAARRKKRGWQPEKKKERLPAELEQMKYALASKRKIRLADVLRVDNKLSIIETINKLMTAEALQNLCHVSRK